MNIKPSSLLYKFMNYYYEKSNLHSIQDHQEYYGTMSSCDIVWIFVKSCFMTAVLMILSYLLFLGPFGTLIAFIAANGFTLQFGSMAYNDLTFVFLIVLFSELIFATVWVSMYIIEKCYRSYQRKKFAKINEQVQPAQDSKVKILWQSLTNKVCHKVTFDE